VGDRGEASDFTQAVNDELLSYLPFEDRQDFEDAARGESSLDDEARSGEITVEPELAPLDQLLGLLDDFSLWFNIIEP
jgi:alkyl sulfatase BDS1-like metallo-beta-lactamase superfamily hydrolase